MYFSVHPVKSHMMSLCPFFGDVSLDCLVEGLSARFLCCAGAVFSFFLVSCQGRGAMLRLC